MKVNITGRGIGLSLGPRGLKIGYSSRYGAYMYQSIPGSGIYRRTYFGKRHATDRDVAETSKPEQASSITSFFRSLWGAISAAPTTRKSPDDPRTAEVSSTFLLQQRDAILALADAEGNIIIHDDAPAWLRDLHHEAERVARSGDDTQALNPEWHGTGTDASTGVTGRCIASTPAKSLINAWARATRHYRPLRKEDVDGILQPALDIGASFHSFTKRNPEGYAGVVFIGSEVFHSARTLVLGNEYQVAAVVSQGVFTTKVRPAHYVVTVFVAFDSARLIERVSEPLTFAMIREDDELRYSFPGGMR